jgi:hypothetical protein
VQRDARAFVGRRDEVAIAAHRVEGALDDRQAQAVAGDTSRRAPTEISCARLSGAVLKRCAW